MVTKRSSPTSWTPVAEPLGERAPAVPVVLGEPVLDRHDRDSARRVARRGRRARRCRARRPRSGRRRRGRTRSSRDRARSPIALAGARRAPAASRTASIAASARLEVRREAALVADRRREAALVEQRLQRVEDLGAHAQALGEGARARRDDHELLEVDRVVGVGAAVDDVQHRHGQRRAPRRRRGSGRAARRRRRGGLRRPPARRRGSRSRRAGPCSASRRASISSARRPRAGRPRRDRRRPARARRRRSRRPASRPCRRTRRRRRAARPPRGRRSRRPDGTAARPRAPDSSSTSTSTVGFPRESRIWRPCTATMVVFTRSPWPGRSSDPAPRAGARANAPLRRRPGAPLPRRGPETGPSPRGARAPDRRSGGGRR